MANNPAPMAYVNFITFDRDFVPQTDYTQTNFVRVTEAAKENGTNVTHERLYAEVTVKEPGYMYIYLSNDNMARTDQPSIVEVYFDDFKVTQIKSPVIQIDDYYPFGAVAQSYQRENSLENKFLYQGKERITDLGIDEYDFGPRRYDPWAPHTTTQDPHAESYYSVSPYSWAMGNPVRYVDPTGMDVTETANGTSYTGADAQAAFSQIQSMYQGSQAGSGNRKEEDPYVLYNGSTKTMQLWDDNDTPDDYSDDAYIGEHDAKNDVTSDSNGKWEDGEYEMDDKNTPFINPEHAASMYTENGSYGTGGVYRAKSFRETTTTLTRSGMAIHAGRASSDWKTARWTYGCIRVTADGFNAIGSAISQYGPLQKVIVTNNRQSTNSASVNSIAPGPIIDEAYL